MSEGIIAFFATFVVCALVAAFGYDVGQLFAQFVVDQYLAAWNVNADRTSYLMLQILSWTFFPAAYIAVAVLYRKGFITLIGLWIFTMMLISRPTYDFLQMIALLDSTPIKGSVLDNIPIQQYGIKLISDIIAAGIIGVLCWRIQQQPPESREHLSRRGRPMRVAGHPQDRWAYLKDLRKRYSDVDGIVIGEARRRDLEADLPAWLIWLIGPFTGCARKLVINLYMSGHIMLIGGPGKGKSFFYKSTLKHWAGGLICYDMRPPEFANDCRAAREEMGRRIVTLNPLLGDESASINVLAHIDPDDYNIETWLDEAYTWMVPNNDSGGANQTFIVGGRNMGRCLLLDLIETSPKGEATLSEFVRRFYEEPEALMQRFEKIAERNGKAALLARGCLSKNKELFSSIQKTGQTQVGFLTNTTFAKIVSGETKVRIDIEQIISGHTDLFLGITSDLIKSAGPMCVTLLMSIMTAISRREKQLDRPLLVCLDEAPAWGKEIGSFIRNGFAELRGKGIILFPSMQSMSQAEEYWSKTTAAGTVDCSEMTLLLGVTAPEERKAIADKWTYTIAEPTIDQQNGKVSIKPKTVPLLPVSEPAALDHFINPRTKKYDVDEVILVHDEYEPARFGLCKTFRRREFNTRMNGLDLSLDGLTSSPRLAAVLVCAQLFGLGIYCVAYKFNPLSLFM